MWFVVFVVVLSFLLYFFGVKSYKHWEEKNVTFIKPLPFFGNMGYNVFQKRSVAHLVQDWYNAHFDKRYVGFFQFLTPTLMIRDPELIKKIAVKEFDTFPEHRPFTADGVDPLWSKNLFAMRGGQKWHDMRSTLSPSFTSSKMKLMFDLMKDCSKQLTKHFKNQNSTTTITVEMKDVFTRFTNDVIATTAFGVNCDSLENRENEFYLMGKEATNFVGLQSLKFFLSAFSPSLSKILNIGIFTSGVRKFFRSLISETIQIREEKQIIRPDMVHLLMEARKSRSKQEVSTNVDVPMVQEKVTKRQKTEITDEDITAQALIFFLAGFDTASTFMCFTAYELAVNPDVQEKLLQEIDQTLKDCNGDFTYESLQSMKYLDMVVTESLRKWPPTPSLDRMSVKPFTIEPELHGEKPLTLDAGTVVWFPSFALQRDPQYYPNPDKFDPERFSEENKDKINPYTYLPFGVGPRNCIGSRFALLEGKLVIAEILKNYEFVPVVESQVPIQLHKGSFPLATENGFWLGLKPRCKV